jgi:hypothetical protein
MRTSPAALVEDPPQSLNPLGFDPAQRQAEFNKFTNKLAERSRSEPRQQVPLMVDVRGTFTSFFAGADRPKRPSEIKEEEAKKAAEQPKVDDPATPVDESKPDPDAGPPPPPKEEANKPALAAEPEMQKQGARPGRIVAIGDADFVRDDLVSGNYQQAGGPVSANGAGPFFAMLLDWLAGDRDLVDLQSKVATDRTLKFVSTEAAPNADPRQGEQQLQRTTNWLRGLNVLVPVAVLTLLGFVVQSIRRAQKRAFLSSLS